jgi:succinate dehydrogenase flavin-adding protein (antitoxin of CptAB toxin-antitoxin module)
MNRVAREKLKWKCRRGLLELDLVLERFLRCQAEALGDAQLARLEALLDLPDNDLWDIVSGRTDRYDPGLADVVARLRTS